MITQSFDRVYKIEIHPIVISDVNKPKLASRIINITLEGGEVVSIILSASRNNLNHLILEGVE